MLDNIYCLGHSALKILYKNKVIYIDPFNLTGNNDKADIIFKDSNTI